MNSQVGDRFTCSNANCGCEVEIKQPSNMSTERSGESKSENSSPQSGTGNAPTMRRTGSEAVSTQGDYGSQGATGEGTFGTASTGDPNALGSGRYDRESTRVRESSGSSALSESGRQRSGFMLICFCGSEMRPGKAGERAQAARARY